MNIFGDWKRRRDALLLSLNQAAGREQLLQEQAASLLFELKRVREDNSRLRVGPSVTAFDTLAQKHALLLHQYQTMEHSKNANALGLEQQLNLAIACMSQTALKKYHSELRQRGMDGQPGTSIFDRPPGMAGTRLRPVKS